VHKDYESVCVDFSASRVQGYGHIATAHNIVYVYLIITVPVNATPIDPAENTRANLGDTQRHSKR
jgi:hypothetical protein